MAGAVNSLANIAKSVTGGSGVTNALFGISQALQLVNQLDKSQDTTIHGIEVTVVGGPYARIERIWQLCLAAAFGKFREGPNFNSKTSEDIFQAEWDITGKVVKFAIISTMSGIGGAAESAVAADPSVVVGQFLTTFGRGIVDTADTEAAFRDMRRESAEKDVLSKNPRQRAIDPRSYLLLGPTQEVCGGRWPSVLNEGATEARRKIGGGSILPRSVQPAAQGKLLNGDDQLILLPDDGRMITSANKIDPNFQWPVPQIDGVSRAGLLALVAAALTNNPDIFPVFPPQTIDKPIDGSQGIISRPAKIYLAGQQEPANIRATIKTFSQRPGISNPSVSLDGYKRLPDKPAALDIAISTVTGGGENNNVQRFRRPDQVQING